MILPTNEQIDFKTPSGQVPVTVIRSSRRTFQISVSPEDGVVFRVPLRASWASADELLKSRAQWIDRMLSRVKERARHASVQGFQNGAVFFILGKPRVLHWDEKDAQWPKLSEASDGWWITFPINMTDHDRVSAAKKALFLWFKRQAEEFLPLRLELWSSRMELVLPSLTLKKPKRLWGSCNKHRRSVNLNWKIVSFPPEIIDYVIIHELGHLKVADHSRQFWDGVEKICPAWRERRKWLREYAHRMVLPG
jgi:predicted metal-dependent hydrolase